MSNHKNWLASEIKRVHELTLILGMFSISCLDRSLQPACTASAGMSPSEYQSRSTQWAYAALGVAWVTRVVVTMPTDFPVEHKQQVVKVIPSDHFLKILYKKFCIHLDINRKLSVIKPYIWFIYTIYLCKGVSGSATMQLLELSKGLSNNYLL